MRARVVAMRGRHGTKAPTRLEGVICIRRKQTDTSAPRMPFLCQILASDAAFRPADGLTSGSAAGDRASDAAIQRARAPWPVCLRPMLGEDGLYGIRHKKSASRGGTSAAATSGCGTGRKMSRALGCPAAGARGSGSAATLGRGRTLHQAAGVVPLCPLGAFLGARRCAPRPAPPASAGRGGPGCRSSGRSDRTSRRGSRACRRRPARAATTTRFEPGPGHPEAEDRLRSSLEALDPCPFAQQAEPRPCRARRRRGRPRRHGRPEPQLGNSEGRGSGTGVPPTHDPWRRLGRTRAVRPPARRAGDITGTSRPTSGSGRTAIELRPRSGARPSSSRGRRRSIRGVPWHGRPASRSASATPRGRRDRRLMSSAANCSVSTRRSSGTPQTSRPSTST